MIIVPDLASVESKAAYHQGSTTAYRQAPSLRFAGLTPHRQQTLSLHVSKYNFNVSFEIFTIGEELTSTIPFFLGISDCLHQKCL